MAIMPLKQSALCCHLQLLVGFKKAFLIQIDTLHLQVGRQANVFFNSLQVAVDELELKSP